MKINDKSLIKEFLKYVSSSILSMIGVACYILADTFFISFGCGSLGLAALNIAAPSFQIVFGIAMMLGVGGATKFTLFKESGQDEKANNVFTLTALIGTVISVIFLIIGLTASRPITIALGANSETVDMATSYLQLIFCFAPFFTANSVLQCFLRNDNAPKLAAIALISGNIFNIIFDYVFIFPCNLGIFGAALATAISPVVSTLIMMIHFIRKRNTFHFVKSKFNIRLILGCMAIGLPSLLAEYSIGTVTIIFNNLILALEGNSGVAAYAIIVSILYVTTCTMNGVAQGVQPLISANVGKNDRITVYRLLIYGILTVSMISVLLYLILFFASDGIVGIFNSEGNEIVQNLGVIGVKLYFISIFFSGFNILFVSYFSASNKAMPSQLISILRGYIVIIPLLFILGKTSGVTGLWIATPICEAIVLLISIVIFTVFLVKEKKKSSL